MQWNITVLLFLKYLSTSSIIIAQSVPVQHLSKGLPPCLTCCLSLQWDISCFCRCPEMLAQVYFYTLCVFLLCLSQTGGGGTFQHSLCLLPVALYYWLTRSYPPSTGLFLILIRYTDQTTCSVGEGTSV